MRESGKPKSAGSWEWFAKLAFLLALALVVWAAVYAFNRFRAQQTQPDPIPAGTIIHLKYDAIAAANSLAAKRLARIRAAGDENGIHRMYATGDALTVWTPARVRVLEPGDKFSKCLVEYGLRKGSVVWIDNAALRLGDRFSR